MGHAPPRLLLRRMADARRRESRWPLFALLVLVVAAALGVVAALLSVPLVVHMGSWLVLYAALWVAYWRPGWARLPVRRRSLLAEFTDAEGYVNWGGLEDELDYRFGLKQRPGPGWASAGPSPVPLAKGGRVPRSRPVPSREAGVYDCVVRDLLDRRAALTLAEDTMVRIVRGGPVSSHGDPSPANPDAPMFPTMAELDDDEEAPF
jgi:hypothetical protein